MTFAARVAFVVATMSACAPTGIPLRDFLYYYQQHHYTIVPMETTAGGVRVDSGGPINLARIDRIFDETEACLVKTFPGGVLPAETKTAASCVGVRFPLPIDRAKISVKIARDGMVSEAHGQQLLPLVASETGDCGKGQRPPCYWRAIIVDKPLTLVVPPSMYLLPDVLIRVSTGCLNPWATPAMAACASPKTGPLDDGTGP